MRQQLHREEQDMPPAAWMRLLIIGLVATMSGAVARAASLTGPANVIDGDTIVVSGRHVRLYALDAPEIDQTCRHNGRPLD
jgi:endonuclease YncB( thermonuclease family)